MEIDETNYELIEKAIKISGMDYKINWFDAENIKGYMYQWDVTGIIEDLLGEISRLEEEIEDMKTPNDYDPKVEIPDIHGKGISW